jgi:hypothetical protein
MSSVGPPLRYENLLDESVSDEEMTKLREIRAQTRALVQNLWEAARDTEAIEVALSPVKQWFKGITQAKGLTRRRKATFIKSRSRLKVTYKGRKGIRKDVGKVECGISIRPKESE